MLPTHYINCDDHNYIRETDKYFRSHSDQEYFYFVSTIYLLFNAVLVRRDLSYFNLKYCVQYSNTFVNIVLNADTVKRDFYYFRMQEWEPDSVHITRKCHLLTRQLLHCETTVMVWAQCLRLILLINLLFWETYIRAPINLVLKQTCTDHLYFLTRLHQLIIF
jgi:hypothetical protein